VRLPTIIRRNGLLRLNRTPLHPLLTLLLPLLLEELALLVRAQTAQLGVALLLLELVGGDLALLGLLLLVEAPDLGDLVIAGCLDAAQRFRAEVCGGHEGVGEAQELGEDGEGGGGVAGELEGEVDALAGFGVVEAGWC
jgi:hypothetical protein